VLPLPLSLILALAALAGPAPAPARPHMVVVLADDLGYGDVGCYGATRIPTPHIDRLAAEGVRLTDAHAPAAICSPSRYGLLTGRYAWRTALKQGNVGRFEPLLIEPSRVTLPGLLREHGYHTACIGKWHLGFGDRPHTDFTAPLAPGPLERGFDVFFGSVGKPGRYFGEPGHSAEERCSCWYIEGHALVVGDEASWEHDEVGPTLTARAVEEIEARAADDAPLFLYLSLTAVHQPLHPAEVVRGKSQAGRYGDYVAEVDWTLGQVLAALAAAGIADDTLVVFTSDNGPERTRVGQAFGHAAAGPFRGAKRDLWEGGHRVPLVARWPGRIPAGTTCDLPVVLTDLFKTCAAAAGLAAPAGAAEDSHDVLPALTGSARVARPPFVLHSSRGAFALRDGRWKLIACRGSGGNTYLAGPDAADPGAPPGQLYDLAADPRETTNLWSAEPERVRHMQALLAAITGEAR
jgi:arylsulfatase A-like enzyme